jgi:hypothetical protein
VDKRVREGREGRVGEGLKVPAFMGRIEAARAAVRAGRSVCVLTGAGISTESGIPDYRFVNSHPTIRFDVVSETCQKNVLEKPQLNSHNGRAYDVQASS